MSGPLSLPGYKQVETSTTRAFRLLSPGIGERVRPCPGDSVTGVDGLRACAVTVSTRAASGVYEDRSGPALVDALIALGFETEGPVVVADGEPLRELLDGVLQRGFDVVITSGGTGLSPDDLTPEITARLLDREVPGIADAVRAAGGERVPTSILSRGTAGTVGRTLVVNLPGSTGGVRDGMAVLGPVLRHAVEQLRGGDH